MLWREVDGRELYCYLWFTVFQLLYADNSSDRVPQRIMLLISIAMNRLIGLCEVYVDF